jgi:gamma-glutamyltranspeptidase/glutathione hydrolase
VHVQPPLSQGVLLAMALQKVRDLAADGTPIDDHVLVEVTGAVFEHRSACGRGEELLHQDVSVDLDRASGRSGARAYLHTAGVATVDADGQVVSSLVSVFDDFGSGVFVPELGIVLNNRAAGFTEGDNAAAPGKRPVHTLAPAMVTTPDGVVGIATPGADGQVQTLLQVLASTTLAGLPLADAVGALRWRSQDGELLVEEGHPAEDELVARGHRVVALPPGDDVFGAVVAAGSRPTPYAVADWRRQSDSRGAT